MKRASVGLLVVGAAGFVVWIAIMAWLMYLGVTDSWISDRFFWWEGVSIAVFVASLIAAKIGIFIGMRA